MALRKSLGFTALLVYGVGAIIGAGIFSVIGAAAGHAGSGLWISFVLAGVVAGLSALSYAELVTSIPKTGAEYVFLRRAFPSRRWLAVTTGLMVSLAGVATASTVGLAFAGYLGVLVSSPAWLMAGLLLLACTALNISGIRESSWANIVLTAVEVGGLAIVVYAGIETEAFAHELWPSEGRNILLATALIFFIYTGFEGIANLAEEARNPQRDLSRAILLSLLITMTLYTLVAFAVTALSDPEELAESDSPLVDAVQSVSPRLAGALVWIALCATANTALITSITASRLVFSMAREGDLPSVLARTLRSRQTPWLAAMVVLCGSLLLLPLGTIETVASVSSLAPLLAFAAINAALIALRFREPDLERPFRVPLSVRRVPIPALLGIGSAMALATQYEASVYWITSGVVAAGVVLALTRGRKADAEHQSD